jgi:hypothetical protein
MRLKTVERGSGLKAKLMLAMIRVFGGRRAPDVVRTLIHRPEFFGAPFGHVLEEALRGTSDWSVGERELFAAFTSKLNQCVF